MRLNYLDFDYSEDEAGNGCFDAMAACAPERQPALHAEVQQVLDWAHEHFKGLCAPLEDGGQWDYDLLSQREHEADSAAFPEGRHVLTLSLSGTAGFCAAFRAAFNA